MSEALSFVGIVVGLGTLMLFAFRGWSVLFLAPACALLAAAFSGFPLLASWTQVFMGSAAGFLGQFLPLFLLGATFAKLMNDSGSVNAIAEFMSARLGPDRAILAVVLAGALLTYGGVSLFVAFFVLVPMAQAMFKAADIPRRLVPATIILGTSTFTMTALPGTPAIQNAIPMPFFGTTAFAAPGLGIIASALMLGIGLTWLQRAKSVAVGGGEGYGQARLSTPDTAQMREHTITASSFDPSEAQQPAAAASQPSFAIALIPFAVMVCTNLILSLVVFRGREATFLARHEWGQTTLGAVAGLWSVLAALILATVTVVALNRKRLTNLRGAIDSGMNAAVLPAMSVASLVGFGAVIATLPAFIVVREWVLGLNGGPLVTLAVATNLLAALTGSASGGLTIALEALGSTYMDIARQSGIDPALMHRVATIGAGTLDILPHNGAVITLLSLCGTNHRESYRLIAEVGIIGSLIALVVVIALGGFFGSF
ncbi:H+/gluconate symporter-like permease [Novosphingobium sp. PhB165]|uniref:GntP family permease n=1 Tax=Novosphingobium sp. PhB165 TaxID=2485105 RepID=UPI0010DFC6FE|nr:GntP family permease [Novosphingobium sp. PhB165]TCM20653.1 H+/gluconate symporter-like permease [Novosphingobium sp. PhB165]